MTEVPGLKELTDKLPTLLTSSSHSEIWGIPLTSPSPQRDLVLNKYLTAHKGDVHAAADGISATLKWRKEFDPIKAMNESQDEARFGGLGFVTLVGSGKENDGSEGGKEGEEGEGRMKVVTWNVYGAVKAHKATFGMYCLYFGIGV